MAIATRFMNAFEVDPVHSTVIFSVRHLDVSTFRASFDGVEGRLLATDSGLRLEGAARVDSISIDDPSEFREHVVRGADFFDGDNHLEIRFVSERLEIDAEGDVKLTGDLLMRGVGHAVAATGSFLPAVEDPFGGRRASLVLETTLDRRDWGLDWQRPLPSGADALGWTVNVSVHLELVETP